MENTKWVNDLHKLGRQILAAMAIVATFWLTMADKEISQSTVMLLGGPTLAYQVIKGKGQ